MSISNAMISVTLMASPPLALARRIDPAPLVGRWVSPADVDIIAHTARYVKPFLQKSLRGRVQTVGAVKRIFLRAVAGPEPGGGLLYYYNRGRAHG